MSLSVTWYDNAAFKVIGHDKTIWLDPSVNKNPDSPIKTEDIHEKANFVLTTHGDPGHFVNSVEVAQRTGSLFLATEELCQHVLNKKQLEKERVVSLKFNQWQNINGLEIFVFEAQHPEQSAETLKVIAKWGGLVTRNAGFVIRMGEASLCHLGDAVYSDVFRKVGQLCSIDVGMIPIQGRKHGDPSTEEAVENGVHIIREIKPAVVLPVVQYTKQANRIEPLRRRLEELNLGTRIIFEKPGVSHSIDS